MSSSSVDQSDKAVDRNKVNYWIQNIGKMLNKDPKKLVADDMQQLKYSTSKLAQVIFQLDRASKDAIMKQYSLIDVLITVLQVVACEHTVNNVIGIFIDIVGKIQPAKRASLLVSHGLTTVLFQILKLAHTSDISLPPEVIISIHVLLSRIGHKDRKFAVRARLHQSLMLTLDMVKDNFHNFRNLQPLLQVLKLYTNNSVNASYLGKHNAVNVMFRVISACGKRHTVDLRLALENLSNMTRSKSNSARLIGMGGVTMLLTLHQEWQILDTKHRNLSIRKAILHILKNITNLKSGRKAFAEADGSRILYESALEASDCRDMESLILLASVILRKCCPRNKLPIPTSLSPITFALPHSPNHIPECYELPNFPKETSSEKESVDASLACKVERVYRAVGEFFTDKVWNGKRAAEESDHSSLDDDDDVDSDDERFRTDADEPEDEQMDGLEPAERRPSEDLRMYDVFFPELIDEGEAKSPSSSEKAVTPCRKSASDLSKTQTSSPSQMPLKHTTSDVGLLDYRKAMTNNTTKPLPQTLSNQKMAPLPNDTDASKEERGVSAVNLKTGTSVISLDVGFKSPSTSKSLKNLPKIKQRRKSSHSKDKKTTRKNSSNSLDDAFGALSFNSSQESCEFEPFLVHRLDDVDEDYCEFVHDTSLYNKMTSSTHSVYYFEKLAYPDLYGIKGQDKKLEPLASRRFGVQRAKIFEDIDRMIHPDLLLDKVVYDMDQLLSDAGGSISSEGSTLSNDDELRIGNMDTSKNHLVFNSKFECGNLRKAIQVREFEYDLILNPDLNTNHHHQWFYFEVSNMRSGRPYRFNIVNCEKLNSQFNFGMQPVMMSVTEASLGNPQWSRVGYDICYYRNHFIRHPFTTGGVKGKSYYTSTFTILFEHEGDICYLSYHYPYTYTALRTHINQWENTYDQSQVYFSSQTLTTTLGGNSVPLLTITAQTKGNDRESLEEFRSRPYIFLTGRVHPGESNSSWVMKGTIDFLLSRKPQAQQAREMFIFKVVPMLNPDGVLNGNHRSSLVAEDLNRRWAKPCSILHPTIYHTKGLLLYLNMINKAPMVYCDYHGHSRRKNIFMYGCSPSQSWITNDTFNPIVQSGKLGDQSVKTLPRLLHGSCSSFCFQNCSYVVERVKESTARVVVWRHVGVNKSYTMESSYCGCDQGKYKDMHLNTNMLEEMGHKFCESLIRLAKQKGTYDQQMPIFETENITSENTAEDFLDENSASSAKVTNPTTLDSLCVPMSETEDEDENEEEDEEEFDDDGADSLSAAIRY